MFCFHKSVLCITCGSVIVALNIQQLEERVEKALDSRLGNGSKLTRKKDCKKNQKEMKKHRGDVQKKGRLTLGCLGRDGDGNHDLREEEDKDSTSSSKAKKKRKREKKRAKFQSKTTNRDERAGSIDEEP
jgi:hypothetical protein